MIGVGVFFCPNVIVYVWSGDVWCWVGFVHFGDGGVFVLLGKWQVVVVFMVVLLLSMSLFLCCHVSVCIIIWFRVSTPFCHLRKKELELINQHFFQRYELFLSRTYFKKRRV